MLMCVCASVGGCGCLYAFRIGSVDKILRFTNTFNCYYYMKNGASWRLAWRVNAFGRESKLRIACVR